jgi:hypothetical protein
VPTDSSLLFAVRFFESNSSAIGNFNTLYHPDWNWQFGEDGAVPPQDVRYSMANLFIFGESSGFVYEFPDVIGFTNEDPAQPDDIRTIPEPSTGALLAVGLLAAVAYRRRRRA